MTRGQQCIGFQLFWRTIRSSEFNNVVSCDSQLQLLQMDLAEFHCSQMFIVSHYLTYTSILFFPGISPQLIILSYSKYKLQLYYAFAFTMSNMFPLFYLYFTTFQNCSVQFLEWVSCNLHTVVFETSFYDPANWNILWNCSPPFFPSLLSLIPLSLPLLSIIIEQNEQWYLTLAPSSRF